MVQSGVHVGSSEIGDARDYSRRGHRFSLFKWFKRSRNKFSSCESIDTFYSSATVRSFAYQTGGATADYLGAKRYIDCGQTDAICTLPATPGKIATRYSLQAFESYGSLPEGDGVQRSLRKRKKVHVKGKRRAPSPPNLLASIAGGSGEKRQTNGRRKRPAPKPPEEIRQVANGQMIQSPNRLSISNDTLVLHEGVLLSRKEFDDSVERSKSANSTVRRETSASGATFNTIGVGMPRPWYKRHVNEQTPKKGDSIADKEDNVLSAGVSTLSRLGLFRKERNTENKAKDAKRRSRSSVLAGAGKSDKEAIVQEEQAKIRTSMLLQTEKFIREEQTTPTEQSPRLNARALISKFNALGNVPRTTINENFLTKNNVDKYTGEPTKNHVAAFETKNNSLEPNMSKYFLAQDLAKAQNKTNESGLMTSRKKDDEGKLISQRHSTTAETKSSIDNQVAMIETGMETIDRQFFNIFHEIDKLRTRELRRQVDRKSERSTEDSALDLKDSLPKCGDGKKLDASEPSTSQESNVTKKAETVNPQPETKLEQREEAADKKKVSSSAQTSGNVRKINSDQDWTRRALNKNEPDKRMRYIYQLIRPKDLGMIEVADSREESGYANVQSYHKGRLQRASSLDGDFRAEGNLPRRNELAEMTSLVSNEKTETRKTRKNMNTLAVNRLLRKLEAAIVSGQHEQAAMFAKELARLKIPCSVVRQKSADDKKPISVNIYIEDKNAHQGPLPLKLTANMTVAQLKLKIHAEFDIPANIQRWIIGKNLADNDEATLGQLQTTEGSALYLYLVAPENKTNTKVKTLPNDNLTPNWNETREEDKVKSDEEEANAAVGEDQRTEDIDMEKVKKERYEELMSLENRDIIPNAETGECPICFINYGPQEGVILRDCLHSFCKVCIANTILYCEEAEVKCPYRDTEYTCESTLQEREIKALVAPEVYQQHLAKSIAQAENNAGNNAFHCKTPDCPGWCIYDDNVNNFLCPVCRANNCLTCQAIHTGKNCRQYQEEIRFSKETDQESKRTAAMLSDMVDRGEALPCPTCAVVLMKKYGCDWLRCSMCKTEICWVTRGPRWGPGGKGDTSGGCRCGENGIKCHPQCNYCH